MLKQVLRGGILYAYGYKWQISYDNGTTWKYLTDEDSDASTGGNSVTLSSVQSKIWIRREAKRYSIPQVYAYTQAVAVTPIKNEISFSTGNNFSVALNGSITMPTIQTTYPSTVKIYNSNNVEIPQGSVQTYSALGYYSYVVKVERIDAPTCPVYSSIDVNVYDIGDCTKTTEKVFATSQSWFTVPLLFIPLGGVANPSQAVDNDMSTYSTITVGLGAVGLGTTWQNLNFGHKIAKGTPVIVKMGQEYSGAQVAGGITVYAVDQNNNPIGPMTAVGEGALLDLLVGDNVFEFKFIPKDSNGNLIDYYGVRVNAGSLLAVANNTKVFGAYYEKTKPVDATCTLSDIIATGAAVPSTHTTPVKLNKYVSDVLWGVEDIGLGVATSLSSVVYPYLAVDDNLDSFAIFNKAVAALNRQKLNVKLRQTARPGDEVRIIMGGFEVPVLDLSLLTDFKVQRYLGNVKVGPEVSGNGFKFLDLNLLAILGNVGNRKAILVSGIGQPFDRVEITYLSTVQVGLLGDYTYIYDVSIMPRMIFDGQDQNNLGATTKLCVGDYLRVSKADICTEYIVNFATAQTDGQGNVTGFMEIPSSQINKVHETNSMVYYEFNSLHQAHLGNLYMRVQTKRQNCSYGDPQYLKVSLENCNDAVVNPVLRDAAKK